MESQYDCTYLPYEKTGKFSKIVTDYVSGSEDLRSFYQFDVDIEGVRAAIEARKDAPVNRKVLVAQLNKQYEDISDKLHVQSAIDSLLDDNTFTICTAHQPNIFLGPLYFIYKIVHTIRLAAVLKEQFPGCHFVPVFYMGSEDADLDELNHVAVDGTLYKWHTTQKGAVGRMRIDTPFLDLVALLSGRLLSEPYGEEIVSKLRECYTLDRSIEQATFRFIHSLFQDKGLVILLPDNAALKSAFISVIEKDVFDHHSTQVVEKTSNALSQKYKAQAYPREINLFYLKDDIRKRIEAEQDYFRVVDTDIIFSKDEMKNEIEAHPERFSPNVILRGLFQEMILPDVAWIGGGGELAYWLQLRDLFYEFQVPFPVLILRNSFLILNERYMKLMEKLNLSITDLFKGEKTLMNEIVQRESELTLHLAAEINSSANIYEAIKLKVNKIDPTLVIHADALKHRQQKLLEAMEKKMLRAEKKKFASEKNHLEKIFRQNFPDGGLQERKESFLLFYAKYGHDFLKMLEKYSLGLEQEFSILAEKIKE